MISRGRDEQGQAVLGLLVTAAVLGLGIFLLVALPYSSAADGRAQARTAADAAALAGAEAARAALLQALADDGFPPGGWPGLLAAAGGASLGAAQAYADANDGDVVEHSFDVGSGRTRVEVVSEDLVQGARPRSRAEARVALPSCSTSFEEQEQPTPSPEPTPSPSASPLPELPPLPPLLVLDCGPGLGPWTLDPVGSAPPQYLLSPGRLDALAERLTVRLVA